MFTQQFSGASDLYTFKIAPDKLTHMFKQNRISIRRIVMNLNCFTEKQPEDNFSRIISSNQILNADSEQS